MMTRNGTEILDIMCQWSEQRSTGQLELRVEWTNYLGRMVGACSSLDNSLLVLDGADIRLIIVGGLAIGPRFP